MDFYRKLQEDERETLAHLEDELRGEKTMAITTTVDTLLVFPETQEGIQQAWNKADAFFKQGFVQGEDIWWNASDLRRYKAVYLADLQGKAGMALMMHNEPWVPRVVEYAQISLRLDD